MQGLAVAFNATVEAVGGGAISALFLGVIDTVLVVLGLERRPGRLTHRLHRVS